MPNITLTVSDEVYTNARVWAAEHGTSVSAVVQYVLSTLRTEWRVKQFLAERQRNPANRRPIAPPRPPIHPGPAPASDGETAT
jgi:hypothetical protein